MQAGEPRGAPDKEPPRQVLQSFCSHRSHRRCGPRGVPPLPNSCTSLQSKYSSMTKQAPIFAAFLCGIFYLSNCSLAAKVVAYNVTRALPENGQTSIASLTRRDPGSVGERLFNNISLGGGYFASVQVGTPAQPLMLLLSTGSSDIWVIDQNSTDCNSNNVCVTPCKLSYPGFVALGRLFQC